MLLEGFEVNKGEIIFLHGNSGCGKTTVLNLVSGVIKSEIEDQVRMRFPEIAYVMHTTTMLSWGDVEKSIAVEEKLREKEINRNLLKELCGKFNLPQHVFRLKTWHLSLGMRQRLEIAKAISFSPDIILLDESFSGIDRNTKVVVLEEVWNWVKYKNGTVIGTAHQIGDLLRLAQRIYWLEGGKIKTSLTISEDVETRIGMSTDSLLSIESAGPIFRYD
ncbi:MAG: ATP-binding cassette domain-containing protein [Candidatus Thiodiazotropha sp.]